MMEKSFNTGSLNLNYAEGLPGGSPILLIHGFALRWQFFQTLLPDFEEHWHLYALDLRGRGKSDRAQSYRMQDYLPDIVSFIENNIKEPPILFGHSLGGMISIMVAANYPQLVKGLIIGDSIISSQYLKQFSETHKDTTIGWLVLARTESLEDIISSLKSQLMTVPGQENPIPAAKVLGENNPFFEFMAQSFYQLDPEVLTADIDHYDETYDHYQTDKLFSKIQCPVLLLQAYPELGGLMRDVDVKQAMSLLPKAQHVKLANIGHYLHLEDKESVVNTITYFLKSLK